MSVLYRQLGSSSLVSGRHGGTYVLCAETKSGGAKLGHLSVLPDRRDSVNPPMPPED